MDSVPTCFPRSDDTRKVGDASGGRQGGENSPPRLGGPRRRSGQPRISGSRVVPDPGPTMGARVGRELVGGFDVVLQRLRILLIIYEMQIL